MNKKHLAITAIILAVVLTWAVSAFADNRPIRLVVNGHEIKPDVELQIAGGRVMAPVRWIAEALGAGVEWNEQTRTVSVDKTDLDGYSRQLDLLQQAVAAKTPEEAAQTWANAVKMRNGAMQYAVLSSALRQIYGPDLKKMGWVTGVSSPWVDSYKVTRTAGSGDDTNRDYEIEFAMKTSTGDAGTETAKLRVNLQEDQCWYVSQVIYESRIGAQLEQEARDYLQEKYGLHYQIKDAQITLIRQSFTGSSAEAEYLARVTTVLGCSKPAEWPPQKGRIRYLEENRPNLTPDEIKKAEFNINSWNSELQEYIENPGENNEFVKVAAEYGAEGLIRVDTVQIFLEDPNGKYLPLNKDEWPIYKSAAELENEGYDEMARMLGK